MYTTHAIRMILCMLGSFKYGRDEMTSFRLWPQGSGQSYRQISQLFVMQTSRSKSANVNFACGLPCNHAACPELPGGVLAVHMDVSCRSMSVLLIVASMHSHSNENRGRESARPSHPVSRGQVVFCHGNACCRLDGFMQARI